MPLGEFADRYPALIGRLLQALQRGRLGHAYLITGDQYSTLVRFVDAWLQVCLCTDRRPDGDACGVCRACRQVETNTVPNLDIVKPMSLSRMIRIDQVREMERNLYLTSGGALKIGLILEADCLNVESQNAFLKTLEEPARDSMLLMVTVSPNALLPTIRSRCQLISLLDNHLQYDIEDLPQLMDSLRSMRQGAGALVASTGAETILRLLASRQAAADEEAKAATRAARDQANAQDLNAAARKKLEEEAKAIASSAYKSRREILLSAIQTWFAQEYLRANGIGESALSNPEFYTGSEPPPADESVAALRALRLCEDLLKQLTYNVDEALAIEDFCQQVCARL